VPFSLLVLYVLGQADTKTAWCTSGELFDRKMKENTAVAIYNQITFPVLEIRHQLDPFTSMHCIIIRVVQLLSLFTKITNRKQRSLTPCSKLEESIR
jgi:hypothetical protein